MTKHCQHCGRLSCRLFGGQNPLHVDLDTLLQGPTITPSRQLPRSSGCNTLPTGSSSSIVQPRSAGPSASEDSACEQLRSIMLAFLKDAAQWDVWAGEDELMLEVQESPVRSAGTHWHCSFTDLSVQLSNARTQSHPLCSLTARLYCSQHCNGYCKAYFCFTGIVVPCNMNVYLAVFIAVSVTIPSAVSVAVATS